MVVWTLASGRNGDVYLLGMSIVTAEEDLPAFEKFGFWQRTN
jgi:hypothetical protein